MLKELPGVAESPTAGGRRAVPEPKNLEAPCGIDGIEPRGRFSTFLNVPSASSHASKASKPSKPPGIFNEFAA